MSEKSLSGAYLFGMETPTKRTNDRPEAAALVRVGHAEQTRDKPSRVTRPVRESYGVTMESAFS